MSRVILLAALLATLAFAPSSAQDKKDWCTDAHMKQMDQTLAKVANATKKKEASMHLKESKAAMAKGDTAGCIKHMELAHKSMGLKT